MESLILAVVLASSGVNLLRREVESGLAQLAVGEDFFEDGAVAGVVETPDQESITFIFDKEQARHVKAVISEHGKPWLAERIAECCEGVTA